MLQQTQVERVVTKYRAFLKKFPNFAALHRASLVQVLTEWQGLGYNRRALMLKKLAARVMADYKGKLPADPKLLDALPGIGKGTAGAIAAFAFQIPVPFIETNIRRVYLHFFFPTRHDVPDRDLLDLIGQTLHAKNPREWYYALMDYGAMLGRQEKENPNRRSRHYASQSRFEGSNRQLRGKILRMMLRGAGLTVAQVGQKTKQPNARIEKILMGLERDGFLKNIKGKFRTKSS
ncbi:MAG: A/G-specific adenine glycosylase [Candidatus Sungbacteria bacterium]|nr:A/G-specific adenine glycosylase [Candidatus Sungbacteria bacterium]